MPTLDPLSHPKPSRCFQHPGFSAVRQEEGIMVDKRSWRLFAAAPLTIAFQKSCYDSDCFTGTTAPLQTQSEI